MLWEKPAYRLINVTHVICIIVHYTFVRMVNWKSEMITYLCIWSASVPICLSFCLCCNHAPNCDIASQGDKAISRNRQKMWYLGCPYHTSGLAVFTPCWQLCSTIADDGGCDKAEGKYSNIGSDLVSREYQVGIFFSKCTSASYCVTPFYRCLHPLFLFLMLWFVLIIDRHAHGSHQSSVTLR